MKKSSVIPVIFLALVLLVCLVPTEGFSAEKATTLRYAHFMTTATPQGKLAQEWCKEVEKRTNGIAKVTLYPGGTLVSVPNTYDAVVKGSIDIGYGIFSYIRGRFPLTEVIDLPLGVKNAYVGNKLINEYYKNFKPKELDDVKVLYLETHGPGLLHFKKPITKMEELKGMKIRSSGLSAKIMQALGATPVSMPVTEAYDAISKGVADGIALPLEGMVNYSLHDLLAYHIENYGSSYVAGFYLVMNKGKWNGLPPDVQNTMEKLSEEWIERAAKMWRDWDEEAKKIILQKGGKFVALSKEEDARWAQTIRPILDDYVKMTKEKGLPGDRALQFCIDHLKIHNK
jgi:TRAP-type transport system periplasmic protein